MIYERRFETNRAPNRYRNIQTGKTSNNAEEIHVLQTTELKFSLICSQQM